jgi:hypothetical protein
MTFGCEIQDCARMVLRKQTQYLFVIAYVALNEYVPWIAIQAAQVFEIAGVCELVEVDDRLARPFKPVEDEIGTDESSTTCNEKRHVKGPTLIRAALVSAALFN